MLEILEHKSSTMIRRMGYYREQQELVVEYSENEIYMYSDVTQDMISTALKASSLGKAITKLRQGLNYDKLYHNPFANEVDSQPKLQPQLCAISMHFQNQTAQYVW